MADGRDNSPHYGLMVIGDDPSGRSKALFDVFHQLSKEEHENYAKAAASLQDAMDGSLRVYVDESLRILQDVAKQIRSVVGSSRSTAQITASGKGWRTTLACSILTFSSALHLYQEQSEAVVKRSFGEDSNELRQVRAEFSSAYDSALAYRLIYRLRNVLVHYSLECVGFRARAGERLSPGGLILQDHEVVVPLRREKFLQPERAVSAAIRDELRALPDDPDLLEVCKEASAALARVHDSIFLLVHPGLEESARTIVRLDQLFGERIGDRALVALPAVPPAPPLSLPHSPLSRQVFDYARQLVQRSH